MLKNVLEQKTEQKQTQKKQGKRSVHFLVCKTNKKALRSYEKLHFDVVGESDLFDEDWWCYEKEL